MAEILQSSNGHLLLIAYNLSSESWDTHTNPETQWQVGPVANTDQTLGCTRMSPAPTVSTP